MKNQNLLVIAIISRPRALKGVQTILKKIGADDQLSSVALRENKLKPFPPPGTDIIVESR